MTTMISKPPRTATGRSPKSFVVTVSMSGNDITHDGWLDHLEILPTIDAEDAANMFDETVARIRDGFAAQNIDAVYTPIRANASGYRKVSFSTEAGTIVEVEKF